MSIIENLNKVSCVKCPETRVYVVVITEHKAIDIVRRKRRLVAFDSEDDIYGIEIPPPGDHGLADAMAKLPARYREVLLLKYAYGYSTAEISGILTMKVGSVRKLIWRAKTALEKIMEQEGNAT